VGKKKREEGRRRREGSLLDERQLCGFERGAKYAAM
jgi:hypothetical protein